MGRELKFRAWVKPAKAMASWEQIVIECDRFSLFKDSNFELMQYTGLKDTNGVEIYEGDIVRRDKNCLWDDGAVIEAVSFSDGCFITNGPLVNICNSFRPEIIGNIHENPELLENDNG